MKKLILSTLILIGFSASLLIFQASCKKEANAEVNIENSEFILISKNDENNIRRLYTADYNGNNIKKINIPINQNIEGACLSPDKKTIFFYTGGNGDGYKCAMDGSNLIKLFDSSKVGFTMIKGAY